MTTETMSKTEIKKKTKDTIETLFKDKGLVAIERSAGAVKYKAIRFDESRKNRIVFQNRRTIQCNLLSGKGWRNLC